MMAVITKVSSVHTSTKNIIYMQGDDIIQNKEFWGSIRVTELLTL